MTFDHLQAIAAPGYLQRPHRPEFHVLLLVEARSATHTVDFENYTLAPGDLLWVRAGQVQAFGDDPLPVGQIVLFQPDFLFPRTQAAAFADDRFSPTYWQLREPEPAAREAFGQLHAAYDTALVRPNHDYSKALKHLLSVLLLRLQDISPTHEMPRRRQDETFARLRDRIEKDFARHHQVLHYANALNHSPRTLSRAALGATGSTAKQLIDQRLILEAKRILAHTTLPVGAIAYELGFDDASNFSSFFIRHTQISPSAFRAELASTGA